MESPQSPRQAPVGECVVGDVQVPAAAAGAALQPRFLGEELVELEKASQCVIEGIPLPVVSRLLGHSQATMTLRYTHVSDKDVEAAAERVGARISALLSCA